MFNENSFNHIIEHQEKDKEKIEKEKILKELAHKIEEIKNKENSIGVGATAEVFISQTNSDVCYKIIHSDGEYNYRNSVDIEGELLAKALEAAKGTGVKVPMPYYSIKDTDSLETLVMERMKATSIKDLITGNMDVPDNFDFKKFVTAVESFFERLHAMNIYHRDAHWGNIMIEEESGAPCIIDFGASVELMLSSEDPYKQTNFKGDTFTFTPDEQKVRQELRVQLRTYLFQKYGNIHNL